MVLHCATPTISPPAVRPCHLHLHLHLHGASGALPHPARGLGHLPRLLAGVSDARAGGSVVCHVRSRVRYDEEDDDEEEEWGRNEDFARMERYTEDARDQALLVKARVDDEVEVVLVFRVPYPSTHRPIRRCVPRLAARSLPAMPRPRPASGAG